MTASYFFTLARTHLTGLCRPWALALVLSASGLPAIADPYNEVNRLTSSGQLEKALAQADAYLVAKPRDPQMRFLKGVALSELGRKAEAEEVFLLLTREYPELPEPYNNLAVLLAARGQYDQARLQLEAALRNDPAYATAHENLGDVLARLAARSYARALQLEPGRSSIQLKMDRLKQMLDPSSRP
jgi:Flp pilus assembly protein TadD